MDVTADDFSRHFSLLSDGALLETNREDLVELAKTCFDQEMSRRGLRTKAVTSQIEETIEPEPEKEELVLIGEYDDPDEAGLAQGLLESASIPCSLGNDSPPVVQLKVPKSFAEQALEILVAPLSDEELAAQAEAANPE